jgi:hypothetical protein
MVMELLKLRTGAYFYYRNHVKGNKNTDYQLAKLKLNRNVLLAKKLPIKKDRPNRLLYYYGNLAIIVEDDTIVWLQNYRDRNNHFYVDKNKYKELNKTLGINTYNHNYNDFVEE